MIKIEAENQKKLKIEQDSKSKDEISTFVWKDAVDSLRDAAYQARQLSSFLGLLSRYRCVVRKAIRPDPWSLIFGPCADSTQKGARWRDLSRC